MKNRNIKEMLFYFGMLFMMIMSLSLAVVDCTGMEMSFSKIFFLTFIITSILSVMVIFPVTLIAAVIPSIGWLLYRYYTDPAAIALIIQEAQEFYNWLYWYIAGYNHFEPAYSLAFLILYTTLASLLAAPVVYSGKGSFALILAGTAVLSFFWFIYVEKARRYLVLFLFAAIMLYSYQVYKKRLKEWKAKDSYMEHNIGYNWMFCSAIIISISLLLSLALPLNIGPARWPWLNDKVVSLFPFISEWRNDSLESFSYGFNSRFSLNSAGYISKKLGGELRLDDSVLMAVKTKEKGTIYLRGTVKEKYFDNGWYKSERRYKEYDPGESMSLPYGEDIKTFERTMDITYKKLLTSSVFAPYSLYQVQHRSRRIYADEDSEVYTSKMTMKDESYTVKSKSPYIDVNRLRQSGVGNLNPMEFKLYTDLASDIPARVKSLSKKITGEYNNNYDKAKAIEKYLRQNYKYTPKPPKLPQRAEFTDHFLFNGKEGYCTYFATTMSVLLRESEIPARYVEGFVSEYGGNGTREVRGTNAHAWIEVYFDDYGWVTFDPTPQYPEIEYVAVPNSDEEIDSDNEGDTTAENIDIDNVSRRQRVLEDRDVDVSGDLYGDNKNEHINIGKLVLFALCAVLLARFLFMYILLSLKEFRLGRVKGQRYAMDYLENIILYFRYAGFEMDKGETLREFLTRVRQKNKEGFSDIPKVTETLERIRYSNHRLDTEDRETLEAFRKNVKHLAVKNAGFVKLFVRLYILGN